MEINWYRCLTYNDAKDYSGVIYLHEWNGAPFYWGKADKSTFGVRYSSGYRHWIEGCLQNGGRLYIGQITNKGKHSLDDIEAFLFKKYGGVINEKIREKQPVKDIKHVGNVPESIERGYPLTSRSTGRAKTARR